MSEPKTIQVSAGTQVVVTTEARGTNAMPVHPRGAVGIIARTPAGTEAHYLIRFPDGFETSFTREQFEILKHFKDRLPSPPSGDGEFELERCIIYRCVVGSRAYGLETDASDTDFRGVYVRGAEILTASLYRVAQVVWDESGLAPEELNFDDRLVHTSIPDMVRQIRVAAKSRLPDGVVMDFGKLGSGEWALIEFNEAWASGLYYCDPDRAFDVIIASQSAHENP